MKENNKTHTTFQVHPVYVGAHVRMYTTVPPVALTPLSPTPPRAHLRPAVCTALQRAGPSSAPKKGASELQYMTYLH